MEKNMRNGKTLAGIMPPVPTPFQEDRGGEVQKIDVNAMRRNLEVWLETGLHGFVFLGSNGEAALLDEKEQIDLVKTAGNLVPPDKWVIAGAHRQRVDQTLEFIGKLADNRVDAALVLPPNYYRPLMSDQALEEYYLQLADASPLPVILYNMPAYSGINLPAGLVCRLSQHPNIIGIKDSSGNIVQIGDIIRNSPSGFSVMAGSGSFLLATLVLGGHGGVCAVANAAPKETLAVYQAFKTGDMDAARKAQFAIMDLNRAVTAGYGIAGLKKALDLRGMYGGLPRKPLLPVSDAGAEAIKIELSALEHP